MPEEPLPETIAKIVHKRQCAYCALIADYERIPDNSVCAYSIFVCAKCLPGESARAFREILPEGFLEF